MDMDMDSDIEEEMAMNVNDRDDREIYLNNYQKRGINVYYDRSGERRMKKVVIHLKSKYSTPRIYILNRLNDEMDKELWWNEDRHATFKICTDTYWDLLKDYEKKCVKRSTNLDHPVDYFEQCFKEVSEMYTEFSIPHASTDMSFYYKNGCDFFLDNGTIIEWMITMLLEGMDTHYISWVNDKTKLFQIFVPLQLLDVFNNANTYHGKPHISFAELRYTLKGYCMRDILIEIDAKKFKYQFNEEWFSKETRIR